jgi:Tfp pilus assembly protein PilO
MTTTRVWTVGAVLVIAGILALGWLLGVAPLLAQTAAAEAERAGIETQNLAQQSQLAVMKADFENLDAVQQELLALQASIPAEERTEVFASAVETFAGANGVVLKSYVAGEMPFLGAQVDGAAPTSTAGVGGVALSTSAGTVYAIPVTIGVEGTPEAAMDFVRTLQAGQRLFLVNSVSFDRGTRGTPSATVTGYIFLLTDRQLAPTPEDAAAAAPEHTSNYEVPDLNEALPEWLGGEGSAPSTVTGGGATPAPTPAPTGTPAP